MSDVKYIDLKEFHDEGYLQEVNRCFLHPLGLALSITVPKPGQEYVVTVTKDKVLEDSWRVEIVGSEGEVWITIFVGTCAHKRAEEYAEIINTPYIGGIVDCRDDPEGLFFDFKTDAEGKEMYLEEATRMFLNVSSKQYDKIAARVKFANENKLPLTTETFPAIQALKYNVE